MKRSIIAATSILFMAVACLAEISGERQVSSPAYEPPFGSRFGSGGASDGHGFLVAWIDSSRNRAARPSPRMYATRVSESGQILDPLGIRIPTITSALSRLNVVYLGDSYLICWSEGDISAPGLMGVRISSDGTLLDPTPRVFADRGSILENGTASDGNRAVIVYTGPAGSLMTVVLDRDANVVAGPRPLTNPAGPSGETAMIASNGHGFLVLHSTNSTSTDTTTALTTALDANGTAGSTTVAPTPGYPGQFRQYRFLASDGDGYMAILLSYTCCESDFTSQHFGPKGEVMEAWPIDGANLITAFAYTGGAYLALEWHQLQYGIPDTIGLRRLTNSGRPSVEYAPFASADNERQSLLISNGSSAFACYHQPFTGSLIDVPSLTSSKPSPIGIAATTQRTPDAATCGVNMAIVWNERDGVYAGRLTYDGQLLDGRGIRVGGVSYSAPRIVFDGTNYIIGWIEGFSHQSVRLARLSPGNGVVLDPGGVTIAQPSGYEYGRGFTLARGFHSTLVAWSDSRNIVANTVDADLTPGNPMNVATPVTFSWAGVIAAAWNGSEWLMVWENIGFSGIESFDPNPVEIDAARLSPQLTLLDSKPIAVSNTYAEQGPLVASDGDGFLVTWSHSVTNYGETIVVARRIASDGSRSPSDAVLLGQGSARSIAWDGLQFDVAFSSALDTSTLYVTHVAAHGSIESLLPFAVVSDRLVPDASLLVTAPGRVAVAYTRIDSRPEYGDIERVFVNVPHLARGRASH